MLQEVAFVAGPLVAGAVIALWSTTAAVAVTAGLTLVGGIAFATSAAARGARAAGPAAALERLATTPGMLTVLMSAAAFGATFGALDVALPAFARDHGSAAAAGVLLSALRGGHRHRLLRLRPAPAAAGGEPPLRAALRAGRARAAAADRHPGARRDARPRGRSRASASRR